MKNVYTIAMLYLLISTSLLSSQNLAVYVSDAANFNSGPYQIAKFDASGNYEGALIRVEDGLVWPQDIIFLDSEEAVLISNLSAAGIISKHNWSNGDLIENFAEGLGGPTRMKIGPDGLLYVLQWSNTINKVLRYNLNGTFVDEFTSVGVSQSIGIDWDSNGDLYVSSYGGNSIRKFDGTTGDDLGLFISSGLQGPTNIWFEADGNLIVFNYNSGIVKRFDATGTLLADLITGVNGCEGFAFFPNGDLLMGVGSDGSIRRYDSNFNFIENFVDPGILLTPNAIVIRDDIPLSVPEKKISHIFVTPTIGNRFLINSLAVQSFETLEVYNNSGTLVDTIVLSDSTEWDASKNAEGIYFIVARQGTDRATQKIIVKKK
ncbi:MAG: T9SS type A sorting domain-containing protein [Altibacter sp.]|uniref:T9SS type A sorting domain-containing protein n=1 Tax=Altibacter sp. TaxID=2024823 RepID=UPI001D83D7DE|nr:T9SS type A sorting domain-containing protein [Altibacter sp.]MBZ0328047.1 T9SS type A sorting domain-containing protein [Altibacter sp.]